jgi:O-antigen ligase
MMERIRSVPLRLPRYWEAPLFVTATFLVFVVARYMQWGARREIFKTLRVEFVLGAALAVACAFIVSANPVRIGRLGTARNVLVGIVLLFVAMLVQIPFAADRPMAESIFVDRVIKFAMLTFFMVVLIRSPRAMRWFLGAFLFACFYVTQEAAQGAITGSLVWQNQGVMRLHGAVPIYAHPNSLGGVAIGLVPFVVFLFPAIRDWKYRLLLLPPLLTAGVCMLYSGSRTTYVGFLGFLLYWWWQSRNKLRWLLVATVLTAAALPVIPGQYVERFRSIGGQEAEGHSKQKRIEILQDAWRIFLDNPAGVGVASFPAVRNRVFGRTQDTHNLYLEVATNLGVQGLAVFCFLIYAMLAALHDARRRFARLSRRLGRAARALAQPPPALRRRLESTGNDLRFMQAVAMATAGFLYIRLVLGLFGMDLYEVYWWFVAGIAFSSLWISYEMKRLVAALEARVAEAKNRG